MITVQINTMTDYEKFTFYQFLKKSFVTSAKEIFFCEPANSESWTMGEDPPNSFRV